MSAQHRRGPAPAWPQWLLGLVDGTIIGLAVFGLACLVMLLLDPAGIR